jgi:hypothetical protein
MVIEAARSMMKQKGLPGWFWGEAVVTVVYLLNRVPCKVVGGRTSFEVWYKKQPAVHHLKTFGCIVYVHNTKPHLKKMDVRGRKMIFVGYEKGTKAFRAYDPITLRWFIHRAVPRYWEKKVKSRGLTWKVLHLQIGVIISKQNQSRHHLVQGEFSNPL